MEKTNAQIACEHDEAAYFFDDGGYGNDADVGGNPTPAATDDPSKCPDCDSVGRYEGRVLIGGRGVYRCECGTAWQNLDETPSTKGSIAVGGVSGSVDD